MTHRNPTLSPFDAYVVYPHIATPHSSSARNQGVNESGAGGERLEATLHDEKLESEARLKQHAKGRYETRHLLLCGFNVIDILRLASPLFAPKREKVFSSGVIC